MNKIIYFSFLQKREKEKIMDSEQQQQQEKIDFIKRHTDYTEDEMILNKLLEFENNEQNVVRDYLGLRIETKETKERERKNQVVYSVNQEIYKQFRLQMLPKKIS